MNKKRRPEDVGIDIHVKRDDFEASQAAALDDDAASPSPQQTSHGGDFNASEDELKTRRIVKARRPGSSAAPAPSVNPFAGIRFDSAAAPAAMPQFNPAAAAPSAPLFPSMSFSQPPQVAPAAAAVPSSSGGPFSSFAKPAPAPAGAPSTATRSEPVSDAEEAYFRAQAGLNKGFATWVQTQLAARPEESWLQGAKDYIAHSAKLGAPPSSSGAALQAKSAASTAAAVISQPGFDGQGQTAKAPAHSGLFGSAIAPAGGASLFGGASSSASAAAAGPGGLNLFGQPGGASLFGQPGGASLFGTPAGLFAAKPPAFAAAHGDQEEDGEEGGEEEEEATVPVAKLRNEEEDAVFEADPAKASVYASDVKEWKAKGKGRIVLLRDKQTGKTRVVLHGDTTGKVMLNAPLNASMLPTLKLDKKAVSVMTVSFSANAAGALEPDNGGKPGMYRLVVQSEDVARKLHEALTKAMC